MPWLGEVLCDISHVTNCFVHLLEGDWRKVFTDHRKASDGLTTGLAYFSRGTGKTDSIIAMALAPLDLFFFRDLTATYFKICFVLHKPKGDLVFLKKYLSIS